MVHDSEEALCIEKLEFASIIADVVASVEHATHEVLRAVKHVTEVVEKACQQVEMVTVLSMTSQAAEIVEHVVTNGELFCQALHSAMPSLAECVVIGAGAVFRFVIQVIFAWKRKQTWASFITEILHALEENAILVVTSLAVDFVSKTTLSFLVKWATAGLGTLLGSVLSCIFGGLGAGYIGYELGDILMKTFGRNLAPTYKKWVPRVLGIAFVIGGVVATVFCPPVGVALAATALTIFATTRVVKLLQKEKHV